MSGRLILFSSELERNAAFPAGTPDGMATGITGVGLIDATLGTANAINEYAPEHILYIGTCGAYPKSGIGIGAVVIGTEIAIGSGDVARGLMRLPTLMPGVLACDKEILATVAAQAASRGGSDTLHVARVVCTLGITENDDLAETLGGTGAAVENMEAFAVARAAGDIPVGVLLGVTNIVGTGGGKEWMKNYVAMMQRLVGLIA